MFSANLYACLLLWIAWFRWQDHVVFWHRNRFVYRFVSVIFNGNVIFPKFPLQLSKSYYLPSMPCLIRYRFWFWWLLSFHIVIASLKIKPLQFHQTKDTFFFIIYEIYAMQKKYLPFRLCIPIFCRFAPTIFLVSVVIHDVLIAPGFFRGSRLNPSDHLTVTVIFEHGSVAAISVISFRGKVNAMLVAIFFVMMATLFNAMVPPFTIVMFVFFTVFFAARFISVVILLNWFVLKLT